MVLEQFGIGRKGGGEGGVLKPTSHPTQKLTQIIDLNVNHATIYLRKEYIGGSLCYLSQGKNS